MKKRIKLLSIVSAILLASCGGNEQKAPIEKDATEVDGSNFLADEGPSYDKTAIDPKAPITELTFKAIGKDMSEMKYDQSSITVPAGSTIKLHFISEATDPSMPHNWVLVRKGTAERVATEGMKAGNDNGFVDGSSKSVLVHTKLLGPGEKEDLTFPAPPAGEYQYVCTYPGHWQIMQGVLIVK